MTMSTQLTVLPPYMPEQLPEPISTKNLPTISRFTDEFGTFLLATKLLDGQVLDRAQRASKSTGERLDRVLTKLGLISEADLILALAKYLNAPVVAAPRIPIEPVLPQIIDADFVRRNKILPMSVIDDVLEVGVVDPFADESLRALAYLTDRTVTVSLFVPAQFEKAFDALYANTASASQTADLHEGVEANDFDVQRLRDLASEAPTIRLVNQIVADAVESQSSDIHIEPTVDSVVIRYRIDGVLQTTKVLNAGMRAAVTSRIKIMSRLDIAERRLPQDGRTKIAFRGVDIDFRVSTIPTAFGESIVMRILDRSRVDLDFAVLGFNDEHVSTFREVIRQPDGIVLVTGPTGSGKTTTLYTALDTLNSPERKIFTVEDPVEYQLGGINQVQVHSAIGLTFPVALRSILRQDPDIIMIGEIRDLETARIAIQASLTGHLVLSTLHTNSASATITRLIDMGIENYLLTSTLKCVVAQRLVRRLCTHCSVPHANSEFLVEEFKRTAPRINLREQPNIREKTGCTECRGTGFSGRSTIAEILMLTPDIRRLILSSSSDTQIEEAARGNGMISMYESGVIKVLNGQTTIDEVLRAARSSQ
jgi:general secretion pathway protein E